MSIRRIVILALAILAVSASVAFAESSRFRGKTEGLFFTTAGQEPHYRHGKVSFTRTGNRLTNFRWEIRVACADGSHRSFLVKPSGFLTLDEDNRFAGRADTPGGTGFDRISGKIRGERASGAVRRVIQLNASGQETAGGQSCNSGRVEWKAHED